MRKIALQFLLLAMVVLAVWRILTSLEPADKLGVKEAGRQTEVELGKLIWELILEEDSVSTDPFVRAATDSILQRLCESSRLNCDNIDLQVLHKPQVNAVALPGPRMLVFTGLLSELDNPDELAGVMAHELAHLQLKHVMQKLTRELGLAVVITAAGGNTGGDVLAEALRILGSRAFDRSLEAEADAQAMQYLLKANIDGEAFIRLMYRMGEGENREDHMMVWWHSHPLFEDRVKKLSQIFIDEQASDSSEFYPSLSPATWQKLQKRLNP